MSELDKDIYIIPVGSIISRRGDKYEVVEYLGIEEKEYQGKQGLRKYKLGKYVAYQLKSDYSGVKGNRTELLISTDKKELEKYDKFSWHLDRENTDPNYKLKSQEKIDTDKRRASTGEVKLEWQGIKPAYLMTKSEYNEAVTKKFREFNRFISKNQKLFSKPDYYGIDYLDWKRFKENFKVKYKGDTAESAFRSTWGYQNREEEIKQASPELVKQLDDYLSFFETIFGKENLPKMQSDEGGSNKRAIRRAIDDGTYEKLLREGKINFTFLKNVFDSVGVSIPTKLEKVEKEVVELGITADVKGSFDKMQKDFIAHIKERFAHQIKYYEDWYRSLFFQSFSNLDEYCRSDKNVPFQKNITEFYVAYSKAKGYDLKPVYRKQRDGSNEFVGYERFHYDIEKYKDFSGKILNPESLAKNKFELVSNWKEVLDDAAKKFANDLFVNFGNRLLTEISPVNIVDKVIPKIESTVINSIDTKSFDGFIDLVYPNGFVLSIETQIFYAGGFNIQVLHIRGLFKFQNKGKFMPINDVVKAYKEFNPKTDIPKQVRLAEKVEEEDEETIEKLEKKHDKSGDRYYTAKHKEAEKKIEREKHQKEISKIEESIEMYKEMLTANPKDTEAKESLEMYKEILSELKKKKFDDGGNVVVTDIKSNLTDEQQKLVRTPEFKKWFGDWETLAKAKSLGHNITGFYKNSFKGNEELFLFEMAIQANSSESERSGAIKVAGEELIELALKLYPNAKLGDKFYPAVSKVVDNNGEPLVVYHGFLSYSKKDWFYEFNRLPAFFSANRAFAESYAETKSMDAGLDKDANSYECFLNIKKLFDPNDKNSIELAKKLLPEKINVSHGTMWFLDADLDKEYVVEMMSGIQTIYPDRMTDDILKLNVGDVFQEPISMTQKEDRILLYKDEDWAYTTDLEYFNKKMEKEVADYVNEGSSTTNFDRKQITYKGQRFYPYVLDEGTWRMKLNEEPIAVEFRNDVEKYKKHFIENINTLPRDDDKIDYFTVKLKDFDKYGYTATISVKKRNLKTYKTKAKDNWTMFENETVQKFLIENGFGGWIAFEKGDKTYAVYKAENIKLADGTNKTFDGNSKDIRLKHGGKLNCDWDKESESCNYGCKKEGGAVISKEKVKPTVDDIGFYSPIEKRILDFKQDKATVNKWKDIVGIKTDEAKFMGLTDYLNSKKPDETLLKIELLNFIKDNHIELVVVNKNDNNTFLGETYIKERENGTYALAYRDTDEFVNDDEFDSPQELTEVYENEEIFSGEDVPYKTKYSKYVLKGDAKNYTELLVMLPDKAQKYRLFYNKLFNLLSEQVKQRLGIKEGTVKWNTFNLYDYKYKLSNEEALTSDELQQLNYIDSLVNTKYDTFTTPHWEEKNILVHLRFDTRTDVNGDKVLLINELQSDWGQKGKKVSFREQKPILKEFKPNDIELIETKHQWQVKGSENNAVGKGTVRNEEAAKEYLARYMNSKVKEKYTQDLMAYESKLPTAPFVTDTTKWVKLGLKFAIQQAVLSDVKYLSWMTGEQENELYDLSKSLSRISWWQVGDDENGWGITTYDKENKIVLKERDTNLKQIEKFVGKEVAEKIKNHEGYTESVGQAKYGELIGDDLKLSGSGMIGFYGSVNKGEVGILGSVLKALVKELTGKSQEIQTIEIPTSQYAIEITPELKSAVSEGIPMFKVGGQVKVKNPYAICTVSLGKVIGTQKRSEWTPAQLKKYEGCVLKVKDTMKDGGQLFTLLYMDKDGKNIVYSKDGYKIAVNDPKDARYVTLWYNDNRVGVLEAREHYLNNYHGHTGKFLSIHAAYIDKPHQNMGFGLKMYQVLREFSAPDVIGFFSDLVNRQNKKVIPRIYSHFNNEIVGDYHIVTYNDGGLVEQTVYFAIYKDDPNHWLMVAKYNLKSDEHVDQIIKLIDNATDGGLRAKAITKKEYEDYELGDEITIDEFKEAIKEIEGNEEDKFKKGGTFCKCKFADNRVPSKHINEYLLSIKK